MRITNSMLVSNYLNDLNNSMTRLSKFQSQLASGKKVPHLRDDPMTVIFSQQAQRRLNRLEHYQNNVQIAYNWATQTETTTREINELLTSAYEACVNAATNAKNGYDLTNIGQELEQMKEQLLSALNSTYGEKFLFGGYNTTGYIDNNDRVVAPFTVEYVSANETQLYYNGFPVSWFLDHYDPTATGEDVWLPTPGYADPFYDVPGYDVNAKGDARFEGIAGYGTSPFYGIPGYDETLPDPWAGITGYDPYAANPFRDVAGYDDTLANPLEGIEGYDSTNPDNPWFNVDGFSRVLPSCWSGVAGFDPLAQNPFAGIAGYDPLQTDPWAGVTGYNPEAETDPWANVAGYDSSQPEPDCYAGISGYDAMVLSSANKWDYVDRDYPGLRQELEAALPYFEPLMNNVISIDVGIDIPMEIQINGLDLIFYDKNDYSKNIFNLIDDLSKAVNGADFNVDVDSITAFIPELQAATNHVLAKVATIGGKVNRLEMLENRYSQDYLNYTQMKSDAEDMDMSEAIMNYKMAEAVYNAALASGAYIIQQTLMDFLR